MRKIILVCIAALSLGGCITASEALRRLDVAIAQGKAFAQHGAQIICTGYLPLVVAFQEVARTGVVNATTVRDVQVAIDILDRECPDVNAGKPVNTATIVRVYGVLMRAAADARRQQANRVLAGG